MGTGPTHHEEVAFHRVTSDKFVVVKVYNPQGIGEGSNVDASIEYIFGEIWIHHLSRELCQLNRPAESVLN